MARFFLYITTIAFFSGFLGTTLLADAAPVSTDPIQNASTKEIIRLDGNKSLQAPPLGTVLSEKVNRGQKRKRPTNIKPPTVKKKKPQEKSINKPKTPTQKPLTEAKKSTEPERPLEEILPQETKSTPVVLRPLKKKTIVLDARRLKDHKFTEVIRYIKENPNIRLKLQNMTIDAESIISLMKGFKEAGVIDQIREIGFVMLPGSPSNQILNEKVFIDKVLPYLGYLEGIELSCLGVSDKVVANLPQKIPHLKSISLFGVGITDKTVSNLAESLPNLTKIHLTNTNLTSKGIKILVEKFAYLRALGISGQNLKDDDFNVIKGEVENLHSFSMVGQTFKDMKTVPNLLNEMPQLHSLDLSETNVTDEVALSLGQTVNKLKVLDISETPITRVGLKGIIENLDLTVLKINHLKGIGNNELKLIGNQQPGLRKFYFSGAYFTDATILNLIMKLPKLMDITLIPNTASDWIMTEPIAEALHLKETKLQYLRIPAKRLPESLHLKLERDIPNLRIEYEG